MDKIDFKKAFKELYTATAAVKEIKAGAGVFLWVDGQGAPGSEAFQQAIMQLYHAAFTAKFSLKAAGRVDFKMNILEALWRIADPKAVPLSEWRWSVLLRVPDELDAAALKATAKQIAEKKGLDVSAVKRKRFNEGRCLQVLHVGPFEQVSEAYAKLWEYAQDNGLEFSGPAHEIYLSDPRRVAPENLKTIVRMPVKKTK